MLVLLDEMEEALRAQRVPRPKMGHVVAEMQASHHRPCISIVDLLCREMLQVFFDILGPAGLSDMIIVAGCKDYCSYMHVAGSTDPAHVLMLDTESLLQDAETRAAGCHVHPTMLVLKTDLLCRTLRLSRCLASRPPTSQ